MIQLKNLMTNKTVWIEKPVEICRRVSMQKVKWLNGGIEFVRLSEKSKRVQIIMISIFFKRVFY